ncbi:hypothetical protein FRUB_00325 [Fimbriiglobus ruber]|uniref:Uncharacterized protein n=1 Tax=Fimbriiglobus ruber TaxID=1908690 RepID=A0A225E989_9BACT|nr:hypothetical protein FRUB_00325 [Fimbriiglobus ruber]
MTGLDARRTQEFLDFAKAKMPDPVEQLVEASNKLPESVRDKFLESHLNDAFEASKKRGTLTDPGLADFQKTTEGVVKIFSLLLKPAHPNLTEDDVQELVMSVDDVQGQLEKAAAELVRESHNAPVSEEAAERSYFRKPRNGVKAK